MDPAIRTRSSGQASSLFSGVVRAPPPPPTDIAVPPPAADIPQPCYSALALDIDGTITTADPRVVYGLVQEARSAGSHVAINTARPQLYCSTVRGSTSRQWQSCHTARRTLPMRVCAWQPSQSRVRAAWAPQRSPGELLRGAANNHWCHRLFFHRL